MAGAILKNAELKLTGLQVQKHQAILDTDEKVRQLHDELERKIRVNVEQWENAKRESRRKAEGLFVY
jgi:hypothetical protein